ncbi:hypothetical protein JMT66_09815 [Kosakonia cowanii]|uniref:hypothetical protein n=1 Tax=Kosakonia cowanii TaxID=208223 RepID=UPI001E5A51CA|nr:hypothetical protein [Kosakonia cowanii]UGS47906.1 hypothetical protein JMT66_09815 [Kosakonia cowanii]
MNVDDCIAIKKPPVVAGGLILNPGSYITAALRVCQDCHYPGYRDSRARHQVGGDRDHPVPVCQTEQACRNRDAETYILQFGDLIKTNRYYFLSCFGLFLSVSLFLSDSFCLSLEVLAVVLFMINSIGYAEFFCTLNIVSSPKYRERNGIKYFSLPVFYKFLFLKRNAPCSFCFNKQAFNALKTPGFI